MNITSIKSKVPLLLWIFLLLNCSLSYGTLVDEFVSRCEFTQEERRRVYPKFVKPIFENPEGYISQQISKICNCKAGKSLIEEIYNLMSHNNGQKIKFVFSEACPMSGDVDEEGNGVVNINFDKCAFQNSNGKFPEVYSLVPTIQGQFELNKICIVKIAPDYSPFWISVAHELIHVLHKMSDPGGYARRIRSTPQNVVKSISEEKDSYLNFFEIRACRLSQELWTNEEERETVIGPGISELTIRKQSGQKIRYIYQSTDKVFFELKKTIDKIIGENLHLPSIELSLDNNFDFGLTPLPILSALYEKHELIEYLVNGGDFISYNLGKSLLSLKKLGFFEGDPSLSGKSLKEKRKKILGEYLLKIK